MSTNARMQHVCIVICCECRCVELLVNVWWPLSSQRKVQVEGGVSFILRHGGSFPTNPRKMVPKSQAEGQRGNRQTAWKTKLIFPRSSPSFPLLPRCCRPPSAVCVRVECCWAFLSWRQWGHGGGTGRRLGHRAARPQLRGGRPPPAPQCPMASRSQLLCRPSFLTSPLRPICCSCSTGSEEKLMAQGMADATANFSLILINHKR